MNKSIIMTLRYQAPTCLVISRFLSNHLSIRKVPRPTADRQHNMAASPLTFGRHECHEWRVWGSFHHRNYESLNGYSGCRIVRQLALIQRILFGNSSLDNLNRLARRKTNEGCTASSGQEEAHRADKNGGHHRINCNLARREILISTSYSLPCHDVFKEHSS